MKLQCIASFSGQHGSYCPRDVIDSDLLPDDVVADFLKAGFVVPVKDGPEKATAPAAPENAAVPPAEAAAAPKPAKTAKPKGN